MRETAIKPGHTSACLAPIESLALITQQEYEMTYRAPLINPNTGEIDSERGNLLTDAQWAKFAHWSWQQRKSVHELITEMKPMLQQVRPESHEVMVEGVLPHCGFYGGIHPSGSCHT